MTQPSLPGVPGIRYGRAAAASSKDPPPATDGTLPLRFRTRINEDDVLLHVAVPGEPTPKGRPRHTVAKIDAETGSLIQGHTYTPTNTRHAEDRLRLIFRAKRRLNQACPGPIGVFAYFRTRHGTADADNLVKLVLDALNGTVIVDDQQVTEMHVHVSRHCTEAGFDLLVWRTGRRAPGQ